MSKAIGRDTFGIRVDEDDILVDKEDKKSAMHLLKHT